MTQELTPTQLKQRLDNGEDILVVDVREIWELNITKLDFAQHIVMNDVPQRAAAEIPKDKTVVFICRSGSRSMRVVQFLVGSGWSAQQVYNLKGGILAWAREIDPSLPQEY
jgi:sulfur-carrier protein adenylyltransferase/sulfurtransferase